MTHYTAWITTDASCLAGDHCDVVVLQDEAASETPTGEPIWTSTGDPLFHATTSVRHDADDHDAVITEALDALQAAGWYGSRSDVEAVETGYIVTVERDTAE